MKNRQFIDAGNIWKTRRRNKKNKKTKTNNKQTNKQHNIRKQTIIT